MALITINLLDSAPAGFLSDTPIEVQRSRLEAILGKPLKRTLWETYELLNAKELEVITWRILGSPPDLLPKVRKPGRPASTQLEAVLEIEQRALRRLSQPIYSKTIKAFLG